MIVTGKAVPRRTFLKGVGAAVALPFLDSMVPAFAASAKLPVRLAFLYVPNGIEMRNWNVPQAGPLAGNLPRIMKPLEAFCGDMIQIGNLTNNSGRALLDGAGDQAAAARTSPCQVRRRHRSGEHLPDPSSPQTDTNALRVARARMDDSRQRGSIATRASLRLHENLRAQRDAGAAQCSTRGPLRAALRHGAILSAGNIAARATPQQHPASSRDTTIAVVARPPTSASLGISLSFVKRSSVAKAEKDSLAVIPAGQAVRRAPDSPSLQAMRDMMRWAFQANITRSYVL